MSAISEVVIIGGHSKDLLFAQLTDIGRINPSYAPPFELTLTHPADKSVTAKVAVRIIGIEAEDGSGHNWCIRGRFVSECFESVPWLGSYFNVGARFTGYYNTRRRSGALAVTA